MYKRIGIDLDNTITNLQPTLWEMAKFYRKPVPCVDMITDYNLSSVYGITEEQSRDFWLAKEYDLCAEAELNGLMLDNIFRLFTDHNTEIFVITNRDIKYFDVTKEWLQRHGIPHKELIMTSGISKVDVLHAYEIELMIDDKPLLFKEVAEAGLKTKMACVDYPYNKAVECDIRLNRKVR